MSYQTAFGHYPLKPIAESLSSLASVSRHFLMSSRMQSLSARAAAEYRPCFVTARRMRSVPSAVFAPVLNPP
jgi:hypothetical protein